MSCVCKNHGKYKKSFDNFIKVNKSNILKPLSLLDKALLNDMRVDHKQLGRIGAYRNDPSLPIELYYYIFSHIDRRNDLHRIARSCTMFCTIIYEMLSGVDINNATLKLNNPVDAMHIINRIIGLTKCACDRCWRYESSLPAQASCIICDKVDFKTNMLRLEFVTCTKYICKNSHMGHKYYLHSFMYHCYKCRSYGDTGIYTNDILGLDYKMSINDRTFLRLDSLLLYGCGQCEYKEHKNKSKLLRYIRIHAENMLVDEAERKHNINVT